MTTRSRIEGALPGMPCSAWHAGQTTAAACRRADGTAGLRCVAGRDLRTIARWLLVVVLFATAALRPGVALAGSTIALVQAAVNGSESAGTSMSVTFPSNNQSGNLLVVTGTMARPSGTLTISDSAGNVFVPAIGPVNDPVQRVNVYVWYVPSAKAGRNTITITPSTTAALEIHASEFSGADPTAPLDRTSGMTGNGTAVSSGSVVPADAGELVFGYTFTANNSVVGSGFTGISYINGDWDEYTVQGTAAPVAATFTQPTGAWIAVMATFKPAGGSTNSYSLSGGLTNLGANASVALTGPSNATTLADASGNFGFAGLANGTYTVTPAKPGVTFTPASATVVVANGNATVSFSAAATTGVIGIDATAFGDGGSAAATISSSAFSTNAGNELLLAFVSTDGVSGSNTSVTAMSGAGLTWTLVQRSNVQPGTAEIWRAFAPAPLSSVTVQATLSQNVSASLVVMSFTGVDPSGINGAGAIGATADSSAAVGAPAGSLVTTRANSIVLGVGNDFSTATARVPGAGQSIVHQYLSPVNDTYWVQMLNQPASASGLTATLDDVAPTADSYNLALVEVLPAPASAPADADVPLPMWSQALLALALCGIAGIATTHRVRI